MSMKRDKIDTILGCPYVKTDGLRDDIFSGGYYK